MTPSPTRRFPSTIPTQRLLLRRPLPSDGAIINAAILETWDDLHRWMDWAQVRPSIQETEARGQRHHQLFEQGDDFNLRAFSRETGEFVSTIGLHPRKADIPSFEIGYWCRASQQGRGYVSEAVRAVAAAAFEHLSAQRIEIICDARNQRSRRVAEQAGFQHEATLHNHRRTLQGDLSDTLIYGLWPAIRVLDPQTEEDLPVSFAEMLP